MSNYVLPKRVPFRGRIRSPKPYMVYGAYTHFHIPNGTLIGSSASAGLTIVTTDTHTDSIRYICNDRQHFIPMRRNTL